ncbi:cytosolic factor, phosphatidylinositol/phosphatidylcholine transfer protein [Lunasporangiospora selenospora]|uniref:Cytosolic factor, phosphatidylinositol/phosphatidylcholine transfer protein n=1 Tax=Lunasporangiospora selenospora TaxID=979761 RepID=A0A9P6FUA1_9FUNG|nr:cytosolic factor, phosphatidylinositol/phosphatidylcholine transfer protein [Lunasporangiospora selenospora]
MSTTTDILPGRVGNLTPEQEHALTEFKELIKAEGLFVPERHDDHYVLRFLRARKFHIANTHKMFVDCETWRRENKVDDLIHSFVFEEEEAVRKCYPRYYHNIDKEGRPIYIEHIGVIDIKTLFKITDEERMTKQHVLSYERLIRDRMPACSKRAGRHIEQCCTILDLKDVSLRQFANAFGFIKRTSAIAQNYYPEMMGKMYVINAPMMFTSVWGMVKPLLDEVTVKKIVILGSDYKKTLLEDIEADNLPTALGGACECAATGGCQVGEPGPWKDPLYMNVA